LRKRTEVPTGGGKPVPKKKTKKKLDWGKGLVEKVMPNRRKSRERKGLRGKGKTPAQGEGRNRS